jgi:hypothetical protein
MIRVTRQIKCLIAKARGEGGHTPPLSEVNFHFICLVTLIINIYGLGVGISTIKKFTSDRGGV